jgi:hypothetical protein
VIATVSFSEVSELIYIQAFSGIGIIPIHDLMDKKFKS